jgi:hypothetical protein
MREINDRDLIITETGFFIIALIALVLIVR